MADKLVSQDDTSNPPIQNNGGDGQPIDAKQMLPDDGNVTRLKVVETPSDDTVINPFDDLDALRNAQDYDEFLSSDRVVAPERPDTVTSFRELR
jgi:hypothetical protein